MLARIVLLIGQQQTKGRKMAVSISVDALTVSEHGETVGVQIDLEEYGTAALSRDVMKTIITRAEWDTIVQAMA